MIYTSWEKLTRYVMSDDKDEVKFSEFESLLMERPANTIYCVKDGKMYGIISMGDIERAYKAKKDYVVVNKQFTSIKPNEYMFVKQIFKDSVRINAVPVVSDSNELIGAYSRWDDLIAINDIRKLRLNKYAADFWEKNKKIALVKPCKEFIKKLELMQRWKDDLLLAGVQVTIISKEEIMDTFENVDCILFTDEDELRGIGSLYTYIFNKEFQWKRVKTYTTIEENIRNAIGGIVGNTILESLQARGIYIVTLNINRKNNKSEYWDSLKKDISNKFSQIGRKSKNILYEEFREDFFAELYSKEYAEKILNQHFTTIHVAGINKLKDVDTETYKVVDGERRTLGQPSDFERSIYFYGPCLIWGGWVDDMHTIESLLQERLNVNGYKVKCVNYGAPADELTRLNRVTSTKFNQGDIVIFCKSGKECEGIPNINIMDICEKHKVPATWMVEHPAHSNHKLNSIYADEIFELVEPIVKENVAVKNPVEIKNTFITLGYLARHFFGFSETHRGIIGSIVMNCNPFTFGHRYLIEQAVKRVDHLIIFVVEEDKSIFNFKERFAMVVEGTKDMENVTVVPSGGGYYHRRHFQSIS